MRVRPLLFALATAMVFGCAGRDSFTGSGTQAGGGNNPGDASQTQPDAGDAGVPPGTTDAGCTLQTLPTGQVAASDTCSVGGAGLTATVIAASCLDVTISVTDGTNCHGTLTGAANAFNGTCNTLTPCVSNNLPGIIRCPVPAGTCTVQICATAGPTPNCPP